MEVSGPDLQSLLSRPGSCVSFGSFPSTGHPDVGDEFRRVLTSHEGTDPVWVSDVASPASISEE
jgi:hypothetical protein